MDWPTQPVEQLPPERFRPPFCPWEACPGAGRPERARFRKHGVFIRLSDRRVVPRFRCLTCGRTCSQQTFACTYYSKRPGLLPEIAAGIVAGSAHRQLARSLGCSHTTVARHDARVGRHCILLLALCLSRLGPLTEAAVYDHFESFVYSQDHACGIGTPVGSRSWFCYGLDCAPHRAGGRRARERRAVGPEHRQPGAVSRAFRATLDRLLARVGPGERLELISDKHPAYSSVLRRHPARARVRHRVYANPSARDTDPDAARERHRALFPVDLLHKLLRHSQAHHRRETIAFGRRLNAVLERCFTFLIWRNLIKGRSERKPDPTTPAMHLGLTDEPWTWSRVLARRLFAWRLPVPADWRTLYRRELVTEILGPNTRHALTNAF